MINTPLKNLIHEVFMNSAAVAFCLLCGSLFGLDFTIISLGLLMLIKMR